MKIKVAKGQGLPQGKMIAEYVSGYLWIGGEKEGDTWCAGTIDEVELKKLYKVLHRKFGKKNPTAGGGEGE